MGILDRLREGIFRVRVIPSQQPEDKTAFTDEAHSTTKQIQEAIDAGKRIDLSQLTELTNLTGDRNLKYKIFEEMVQDGRIGAAIEMYANDTVQYNSEGKIVWVESENPDVAAYGNKLLEDLNVEDNLWSWAYCLWLYGDVYLETFENTSNNNTKPSLLLEPIKNSANIKLQKDIEGAKLERYIEKVPNAADIYDLQYRGKTAGFVRNYDNLQNNVDVVNHTYMYSQNITDITILNPTKFVHICLSPNINRFPEKFQLIQETEAEKTQADGSINGDSYEGTSGGTLAFNVKSGQSVLENVYGAYQTLKLKEDSVLLERLTKASITRVIQVELGDLPESQKRRKLQEIKNQIEQQLIINKDAGTVQSRAGAQPIENIIYTTTKNGLGTISSINIGGDVNIGELNDVEDSENKMYGSLLIPKALLGADMDGSGLSNGGSLTEMNTTYARRIKRGQIAIISGLKTLINIFALGDGLGSKVVNNFRVKLTPIITVEDNRRDELLQTKIRNVNDILSLMNNMDNVDEAVKLDMIIQWLSTYLNQQDIVDILNEHLKELDIKKTDKDQEKHENEIGGEDDTDFELSSKGPDSHIDIDFGNTKDNEEVESNNEEVESNNEVELAPQVDIASIEGEDLL